MYMYRATHSLPEIDRLHLLLVGVLLCLLLDTNAESECDKPCTEVYDPVCSSDNKTELNDCYFKRSVCRSQYTLTLKHRGVCECAASKWCPNELQPLCGSDNNDYNNMCELELANACREDLEITVRHNGFCVSDPRDPHCMTNTACPQSYEPVCGSDGKTYSNECSLTSNNVCRPKAEHIKIAHKGLCQRGVQIGLYIGIAALAVILVVVVIGGTVILVKKKKSLEEKNCPNNISNELYRI